VLHHCFQWFNTPPLPSGVSDTPLWTLVGWLGQGRFAVSAFIAISGFSLMLPVVRGDRRLPNGTWDFFLRRARRILPPYYFALALSLLAIWLLSGRYVGSAWLSNLPVTPNVVITHVLLLHDLDAPVMYGINGPFWSIALEWHIYFAFPLLVLLARKLGVPAVVATTMLLSVIGFTLLLYVDRSGALANAYVAGQHLTQYFPGNVPLLIDFFGLFALGMLGATTAYAPQPAWAALRGRIPWGPLALAFTAAYIALFYVFDGLAQRWPRAFYLDVATALLVMILFNWAAASERNPARAVLGWRPLATVGTFAYSIYLIHVPILGALFSFVAYPLILSPLQPNRLVALGIFIVVALPVVLVLAYIFFLFCERPFLNPPGGVQRARAEAVAAQLAPAQAG
jgi:peptidoglycan/LPS O-acetylase OafA/YrhL